MVGLRRAAATPSLVAALASLVFSFRGAVVLLLTGGLVMNYEQGRNYLVPAESGGNESGVRGGGGGSRSGGGGGGAGAPLVVATSRTSSKKAATKACNPSFEGLMTLNDAQKRMVIDKDEVAKSYGPKSEGGGGIVDRLKEVQHLTVVNYEKFLTAPPGKEHYPLIHYLVGTYGAGTGTGTGKGGEDCRHVVDIGTRYLASSVALASPLAASKAGATPAPVWTFDLPTSRERVAAFRGKSEQEWLDEAHTLGISVAFHNVDLLTVPEEDFRKYMSTWLILLDTAHLPKTVPFEIEFVQRLRAVGYQGLLLLDDIHLNPEMKEWWADLQAGATTSDPPYHIYDVTKVGHATGTGLIDFSRSITVRV